MVCAFGYSLYRAELVTPPVSFLLSDHSGRFLGDVGSDQKLGYGYWPLDEVPQRVAAATLAIEDHRFNIHPGIDPLAVARAAWQNTKSGHRVSGASTLAMQVARMQDPQARGYGAKISEMWRSLVLTVKFGRGAILSNYLTRVPYGNNFHGIAYAARRYFAKPVDDLSWAEIAFLSAIPQAPTRMNPFRSSGREHAVTRGMQILQLLRSNEVISEAEYALAHAQIAMLTVVATVQRPLSAMHAVLKLEREIESQRTQLTAARHFALTTTIDLDIQRTAALAAFDAVEKGASRGIDNAAVVVVDLASNSVRAWVGSADYFDAQHAGSMDFAEAERSPGSALKPFIYALALENGIITAASILDDLPVRAEGIVNADHQYLGPMLVRQALANSRNAPAAMLLSQVGLDQTYGFLRELNLAGGDHSPRTYGLGLAIGAMPVTLENTVRAYTIFARDGELRNLRWLENMVEAPGTRVLSVPTARQINIFLSDPVARLPSFPRMGFSEYPFPVAIKTGTSQGFRDAWTMAYSKRFLVGVWLGNVNAQPMNTVTGGNDAAAVAQRLMLSLHQTQLGGFDDLSFPAPPGYERVSICALSGKRASVYCERKFDEWFSPNTVPQDVDDVYLYVAVDKRTGTIANRYTPERDMARRTYLNLPPRYSEWALRASLPLLPTQFVSASQKTLFKTRAPVAEEAEVSILAPTDNMRIFRDPEMPADFSSLPLRAVINPGGKQVLWYVDGLPYKLVNSPYTTQWPLKPGVHQFYAEIPNTTIRSAVVKVEIF